MWGALWKPSSSGPRYRIASPMARSESSAGTDPEAKNWPAIPHIGLVTGRYRIGNHESGECHGLGVGGIVGS